MTHLTELWKSTPFKIAILNGVTSSLLIVLTALILYHNFHSISRERLEHLLMDEYAILEERYAAGGLDGLTEELERSARAYSDENRIYAVFSGDGTIISGNIQTAPNFAGFEEFGAKAFGLASSFHYMGLSRPLGDYTVVIAVETRTFDRISYSLYTTLLWASLAIGALSIAIGGIIGSNAASRLRNISQSVDSFAKGKIDTRISLTGSGDDIDNLSMQVNNKLDRIQQLMMAYRDVGADIAHDMRTPLSRLYLDLQTMLANCREDGALYNALESATAQTECVISLFESILTLSRIENNPETTHFQRVDLGAICTDLVETYQTIAMEKGQMISCSCKTDKTIAVKGDRRLLTQMIVNLIENAINHTPSGSRIQLDIGKDSANRVYLTVADNGPGVSPDEREKVFQRFYRGERSRTTPGSGLGMVLIRAIADNHNASITLDDANPGLIVRIEFPIPR